jgi:hypothetical protein
LADRSANSSGDGREIGDASRLLHVVGDRSRSCDLFQFEAFAKRVTIGVQDALLDFRLFAIPDSPELIASRLS